MIGRHHSHGKFESTHVDVVPLVDCIMVLLIFLMISSAFVSDPGIEVQKPDVGGDQHGDQHALLIAISRDDRIYFDGQEVSIDRLPSLVKQVAIGRSPVLIIRADTHSSHGVFAATYAAAKRAGIQQVQFATARAD